MPATVWKGFISFGLVSFPVRLFSAARSQSIHFHMLHKKDQSRVKEVWYCIKEEKRIERSEMEKGYEVSKGKYVVVEDDDLKKIAPTSSTTMDILQFVDNGEVDPLYFESSYYVAAEDETAKPYVLFVAALTGTKQDAIAKITMHNREHIALIRPVDGGLLLHTLYFADELQQTHRREAPKTKYSAKELELAKSLVSHLKAPFKPQEFKDTYRASVERLIEEKRKGQKITAVEQPRKAPVIDLMEALKRSLEASGAATSGKTGSSRTGTKKASQRHKAA
jgi:DNA end-binding protein Ku